MVASPQAELLFVSKISQSGFLVKRTKTDKELGILDKFVDAGDVGGGTSGSWWVLCHWEMPGFNKGVTGWSKCHILADNMVNFFVNSITQS